MRAIVWRNVFFAFLVLQLPFPCVPALAGDIPPDSRVYPFLEQLASWGVIEDALMGTRPMTRREASRLALEAAQWLDRMKYQGKPVPREIVRVVDGLRNEIGGKFEEGDAWYLKPIGLPEIQLLYLEGKRSFIPSIKSQQHGLIYNNEGVEPEEGLNGYFNLDVEAAVGPVSIFVRPLVSLDGRTKGTLQRGYVRLSGPNLDLEAGRISLWWGQGYHGTLFLTTNARPIEAIRLATPHPFLLPSMLRRMGPFRMELFAGRLEENRAVPEPYFAGARLNFKPHPVLELGLTRMFLMGGDGRPRLTPSRLWRIVFGNNRVGNEDLSSAIAGLDYRLILPLFHLYGELGMEEDKGSLPSEAAYTVGLYYPLMRGLHVRAEYADMTDETWQVHRIYPSGYTHENRVLGHHAGPGARDLFLEIGFMDGSRINGRISLDFEERGVTTQPVTEEHLQVATEWEIDIGRSLIPWRIAVGVGYGRVTNADYVPGATRDLVLFQVGLTGRM